VIVLKGAARLRFEDGTVEMRPGDFVNIPAHAKHRVEWTTPDEANDLAGGLLYNLRRLHGP
jgi:cupin 2 domain-containing protein